ncbi:MAG TPA: Rrf2 family transcriptional regulator [Candidatus Kapabacteria bacterium]|nr:Rrf2 family transcriptional regulator [Candidatus Kapabacteria bacterium]
MKVSAQEEYGLRCILQLAAQPAGAPMTVGEIARREGISAAYAEKLLRILGKAGLTHGIRGANGGYALARSAEQITLGDVSRALDGRQTWDEICTKHTGDRDTCIHEGSCRILPIWQGITGYVHGLLDSISISQLLRGQAVPPAPIAPESLRIINGSLFFGADT